MLFTQCTKRTRHLYIVNNEIMQQMHYVDQWHMQGLRGAEKKNWLSIFIWNWVFARVCVSVYFSSACASPDLITCAQYLLEQGYTLKKQYLLSVGSTGRRCSRRAAAFHHGWACLSAECRAAAYRSDSGAQLRGPPLIPNLGSLSKCVRSYNLASQTHSWRGWI